MKCPETGIEIGKKAGIDIYKHTISVFHLEDKGAQKLLEELANDQSERAKRIRLLLQAALKEE